MNADFALLEDDFEDITIAEYGMRGLLEDRLVGHFRAHGMGMEPPLEHWYLLGDNRSVWHWGSVDSLNMPTLQ